MGWGTRHLRGALAWSGVVALLAAVLSCASERADSTQLIVAVHSEFEPSRELDHVSIRVGEHERVLTVVTRTVELSERAKTTTVPFSFGVVPPGGRHSAQVEIELSGWSSGDKLLARVRARVGFVRGQRRRLDLELTRSCRPLADSCSSDQTCRAGQCFGYDVDATVLPESGTGSELVSMSPEPIGSATSDTSAPPIPNWHDCAENPEPWRDIGRKLTRTADDLVCPVLTTGMVWGANHNSRAANEQAYGGYIERALEISTDIIGITVVQSNGTFGTVGFSSWVTAGSDAIPSLEDALALPALQQAEQPLQLIVLEEQAEPTQLAEELPGLLLRAGIARACRPIYLMATGQHSFEGLRRMRSNIHRRADWEPLQRVLHFGRRIESSGVGEVATELAEAQAHGFDRVAISAARFDIPYLLYQARRRALDVSVFDNYDSSMVTSFCGAVAGVEKLILLDRPPYLHQLDETSQRVSMSRTVIDLDVSQSELSAPMISYHGYPDTADSRELAVGDGTSNQPMLAEARADWGDPGHVLRFSAELKQSLVLHDAEYDVQLPDKGFFSVPHMSIAVTARFGASQLAVGERQVLVSKSVEKTGWVLEYVNEGDGTGVRFRWYGTAIESGVPGEGKVFLPNTALPTQTEALLMIHVLVTSGTLQIVSGISEAKAAVTDPPVQLLIVPNDAPVTLGADPDRASGFFDGDIQRVRVVAHY